MNRFFVNKEVYKERLDICRGCDEYFKPTGSCKVCGCFMRIKASMGVMECPNEYWLATQEYERLIELYNTIHDTTYSVNTNCSSCLKTMYLFMKDVITKI